MNADISLLENRANEQLACMFGAGIKVGDLCPCGKHDLKLSDKNSLVTRGLVCGAGTNNSLFITGGTGWRCSFYNAWSSMLERIYSPKKLDRYPSYEGVKICPEWLKFSSFVQWMAKEDWGGLQLDKDIRVMGSKKYSPETAAFVSREVNNSIISRAGDRGLDPLGVSFNKSKGKYRANCCNGAGKNIHLGYFTCAHEAHKAWQAYKADYLGRLAERQVNPRVAEGLMLRVTQLNRHIRLDRETLCLNHCRSIKW